MAAKSKKDNFLMFKDRPLVRSGNTIYYGNPNDEFVAMLQILSSEQNGDLSISKKVVVQVIATDPSIPPKDRILKRAEKDGLYNALNIASIWLNRSAT